MDYSQDEQGEIRGISVIVQEESTYQTILQSCDADLSNPHHHSSESRRSMTAEDSRFISSILGEWRPVSANNVDTYLGKRGFTGQQKSVFEFSHLHFEMDGEMFKSYYQHEGEMHYLISTEFERTFVRNGVIRTFFVDDDTLHTIAMEMYSGKVICREKKFVENGQLHVVRKRDGLECSRIYDRVVEGVSDQIEDCENRVEQVDDGRILQQLAVLQEQMVERIGKDDSLYLLQQDHYLDLKCTLSKLLTELADVKESVRNTQGLGAKLIENLSPIRPSTQLALRGGRELSPLTPPALVDQRDHRDQSTQSEESYDQVIERQKAPATMQFLQVSLEELLHGSIKPVTVEKKCMTSMGERIERRVYNVRIPPGAVPGTQITFAKEGPQTPNMIPGDLVFILTDQPHLKFTRSGANLVRIENFANPPALSVFMVPTIDGYDYPVKFEDVVRGCGVVKCPGMGLPVPNTLFRGDMIVKFVMMPPY